MRTSFRAAFTFVLSILIYSQLGLGQAPQKTAPSPSGYPEDWSSRHVIYTNPDRLAKNTTLHDPRAWPAIHRMWRGQNGVQAAKSQLERSLGPSQAMRPFPPVHWPPARRKSNSVVDWSMPLGSGGMPVGETPAKYTFSDTSTLTFPASCNNDFVVFVLNAAPVAGSQANIVAYNNLYTGTSSSSCPNGPQTPPTTNYTAPTVLFSYAAGTGAVVLSPSLSLGGDKVAFVETPAAGNSTFDVLTWTAGQGTNPTTGSVAPAAAALTQLDYTNVTNGGCTANPSVNNYSSPFVDYNSDAAYIAADNGNLYRIKSVFGGTPTLDYCITVNAGATFLTSPVYDPNSNKVFVSDGNTVYAYTPGASSFTAAGSITVASGNGIVLSPVVDVSNSWVYVFSSANAAGTSSMVSQMPETLASHLDATMGGNSPGFILDGAFDNNYFLTGPSAGTLYACGTQGTTNTNKNKPGLYGFTFNANGTLKTTATLSNDTKINLSGNPTGTTCAPLTEYYDGTHDRLFVGVGHNSGGQVTMWDITTRITVNTTSPSATATGYYGGTSGITIDNNSGSAQASSIYFGTLATNAASNCAANQYCAVKLTQGTLQ